MMSRGPYSMLLLLAMSLPGAARALGLGEIRVDSALNEPLSAQIDIVGATRDELAAITATVANRDIFARYGADRPSFLSSATFKVGMDSNGRPVLNIRSSEPFTDPLVSFLVDLRWGKNDVVREYSLLLDPPGLNSAPRSATVQVAATTAPEPATSAYTAPGADTWGETHAEAANAPSVTHMASLDQSHHRVSPGETLRAIARRAGAHTEPQIQRTMLAIFRANPTAFAGNINRMNSGAMLQIPSQSNIEAISAADAKREVKAQMTAWRQEGRPAKLQQLAAAAAVPAASTVPAAQATPASAPADAVLNTRVQTLEKALDDMHQQLANDDAKIQGLKAAATRTEVAPAALAATPVAAPSTHAASAPAPVAIAAAPVVAVTPVVAAPRAAPPVAVAATPAPPVTHPAVVISPSNSASKPILASVAPQGIGRRALLGPLAVALGLLLAGVAYARRRLARAAENSTATLEPLAGDILDVPFTPVSPSKSDKDLPVVAKASSTPAITAHAVAKMIAPVAISQSVEPGVEAARPAGAARRKEHPVADAPKIRWPAPTPDAQTEKLEIDTELLERSYLESLGIDGSFDAAVVGKPTHDPMSSDTALVDTSDLEASTIGASNLDTAVMKSSDLNTMIMVEPDLLDIEGLDDLAILEDTNKLATTNRIDVGAINKTELDYNLLDLDATAQHVHMPSDLHDKSEVKERRSNIVDVLKLAIERDPFRTDLRMKLLETYYIAAATNQRAFVEVVRKLAVDRGTLSNEEWAKIMTMGREIAAGDSLFTDGAKIAAA